MDNKILCCIPSYDGPDASPFFHFLLFAAECGKAEERKEYGVRWNVGGPKVKTHSVRNQACQYALIGGATHLLFIDDDMLVPEKLIESLLAADKNIISPIFFRSGPPFDPLVFDLSPGNEPIPMYDYPVDKVFEAPGGVGTGVMLIKTTVLMAMMDDQPWFRYPENGSMSMDLDFCRRAAIRGHVSFCDSSILVEQIGAPAAHGRIQWLTRKNR